MLWIFTLWMINDQRTKVNNDSLIVLVTSVSKQPKMFPQSKRRLRKNSQCESISFLRGWNSEDFDHSFCRLNRLLEKEGHCNYFYFLGVYTFQLVQNLCVCTIVSQPLSECVQEKMLRRKPTRLELKIDDTDEFESIKKELEVIFQFYHLAVIG